MDRKLLFVGVSLLSCFTSVHADDVLSHVIEYDGTQVSSRTDYTYDANGMVIEEFITRPSPSNPSVMSNYERLITVMIHRNAVILWPITCGTLPR